MSWLEVSRCYFAGAQRQTVTTKQLGGEKWKSVQDQFEFKCCLVIAVLLNMNDNVREEWKYVGSDG